MHKIGLKQVIILILTSCLGIRWIPVAGAIGPAALGFWLVGAVVFLLPLALIVMELSSNFEGNGGIHLWVKQAYGERTAYYVAWFYWVNNFFFYPALVVFMVANFAYLIGYKELASNQVFVVSCVIAALWLAILINLRGIKLVSDISGWACFLNVGLGVFIIITGIIVWWRGQPMATQFSWVSLIPTASIQQNLSNLTLLMFALSGVELIPTLAGSIQNSRRTLARGVGIACWLVVFIYIAGTLAINTILSPQQLNNTTGLMEALEAIALHFHQQWLATALIFALLLVELGALIVWLVAPTIMFFECVEPGIIPSWLGRLNSRQVPAHALVVIGVAVTLIVIATQYLPSVNSIFTTLVLMGTIVYFLPYLFLAASYLKLRNTQQLKITLVNSSLAQLSALSLTIAILFGIGLSFVPSAELKTWHDQAIFEAVLSGGPLLFCTAGYLLYKLRQRHCQ